MAKYSFRKWCATCCCLPLGRDHFALACLRLSPKRNVERHGQGIAGHNSSGSNRRCERTRMAYTISGVTCWCYAGPRKKNTSSRKEVTCREEMSSLVTWCFYYVRFFSSLKFHYFFWCRIWPPMFGATDGILTEPSLAFCQRFLTVFWRSAN